MAQKDLFENAREVSDEFDDSINEAKYKEDINRISKSIHVETLQSKSEFEMRLNDYDGENKINDTFRELIWNTRAKEHVEEYERKNAPKEKPTKRRKWSTEETDFIRKNIKLKPGVLFKSSILSGRTLSSISSKYYRIRKQAI